MGQALHLQAPAYLPRAMGAEEVHSARSNKGIFADTKSNAGLGGNGLVGRREPSQHPAEKPVPPGGRFQLPTLFVL